MRTNVMSTSVIVYIVTSCIPSTSSHRRCHFDQKGRFANKSNSEIETGKVEAEITRSSGARDVCLPSSLAEFVQETIAGDASSRRCSCERGARGRAGVAELEQQLLLQLARRAWGAAAAHAEQKWRRAWGAAAAHAEQKCLEALFAEPERLSAEELAREHEELT
jgi:hypothetical protein